MKYKTKNAVFLSTQLYSCILALKLKDEFNINPLFFHTSLETENFIDNNFPQAITQDYYDSIKGIIPSSFNEFDKNILNLDMINKLSDSEYISISMLDRNDSFSDSFKYRDRLEFYYNMVSYWVFVLKKLKINIVFFEEEPHQMNDYVLYKICEQLKIETVLFVRTIADLGILPMKKFESGSEKLKIIYNENLKKYKNGKKIGFPKKLENYFNELNSNYEDIVNSHLWNQIDGYRNLIKKHKSPFVNFRFFTKKIFGFFDNNLIDRINLFRAKNFNSDQKELKKFFRDSNMKYFNYLINKTKTILKKIENKKIYIKLSNYDLDLKKEYLFVAFQYQPEKSTCPLGNRFNNQILMLRKIREMLPEKIKIYVKEHPSQFIFDHTRFGEINRDKEFYNKIIQIPNVELVPIDFNSFDLIDNSIAVASITGSIGWEAVNRGKNALCFGYSWMRNCEGIHTILSDEDLIEKIDSILSGNLKVNIDKVKIFGFSIFNLKFQAAIGGKKALDYKNISEEKNAQIHINAFKWLFNN